MGKYLDMIRVEEAHRQQPLNRAATPELRLTISPTVPAIDQSTTETEPSPLPRHCFVTYIDGHGRLLGGWDERATSTVKRCHGTGQSCQVELSDGRRIPLRSIRAVGQTNEDGRLLAAWTVRECGLDGTNTTIREESSNAI